VAGQSCWLVARSGWPAGLMILSRRIIACVPAARHPAGSRAAALTCWLTPPPALIKKTVVLQLTRSGWPGDKKAVSLLHNFRRPAREKRVSGRSPSRWSERSLCAPSSGCAWRKEICDTCHTRKRKRRRGMCDVTLGDVFSRAGPQDEDEEEWPIVADEGLRSLA